MTFLPYILTACAVSVQIAPTEAYLVSNQWDRIFEIARDDLEVRRQLLAVVASAEEILKKGPSNWVRPYSLDQLPLSKRPSNLARLGGNAELLGLALSDCDQAQFLQKEVLILAAAARYTNRPDLLARCIEILAETVRHVPLQRPGYTLKSAEDRLPPGGDGVWLATSWGINGIVRITEMLGDCLPPALRGDLRQQVRSELERIYQDWKDERPWFVKVKAVTSNQWVEPSVALIQGAGMLESNEARRYYELGVKNLQLTLAALGPDGAWPEGTSYAEQTAGRLLDAVMLTRGRGDGRLGQYGYVTNAWRWMLHMRMPRHWLVNFGDCSTGVVPPWFRDTPSPALASAALATTDRRAIGLTKAFVPKGGSELHSLSFFTISKAVPTIPKEELSTHEYFPSQAVVCWRSSWDNARALGIWVKGGTAAELHGHRDQGGLGIYRGNQAILIDCGRSGYGDTQYERVALASGHSVLQIGASQDLSRGCSAPMAVRRLDAGGGEVTVDAGDCYQTGTIWRRRVAWEMDGLVTVVDSATLPTPTSGEWFRFHTGSRTPLDIRNERDLWMIRWPGATITIEADQKIAVSQVLWPDYLDGEGSHYLVNVSTVSPTFDLRLTTRISFPGPGE